MIMQRPDHDNDEYFAVSPAPGDTFDALKESASVPGFLYRGVPQNLGRRTFRIDAADTRTVQINRPAWELSRRLQRESNYAELFFG